MNGYVALFFGLLWAILFIGSAVLLINDGMNAYDDYRERKRFLGILERTGTPPTKEKTK